MSRSLGAKRYLAFDTSSVTGVVVAFEISDTKDNSLRMVAEWTLSLETSRHSERLLWTIDTVLQSAGWKIEDLSAIGVGIGPGSFTGLRIGVTTARMLAAQLKIPVTPISSLSLLARGAVEWIESAMSIEPKLQKSLASTVIMACTDATKGEWFCLTGNAKALSGCVMMAEGDRPGIWSRGAKERVIIPQDLIEEISKDLKKNKAARWMAIGQSVERYEQDFAKLPQKRRIQAPTHLNVVKASLLARLVWEAVQQGGLREPESLKPRYLRDSDAEVKLRKGLLKASPIENLPAGSAFQRGGIA